MYIWDTKIGNLPTICGKTSFSALLLQRIHTIIGIIGNADNTFTFDASYNNVFCYGKEVDDFHTLDKQKLFATQELYKMVKSLQEEIKILKNNNV